MLQSFQLQGALPLTSEQGLCSWTPLGSALDTAGALLHPLTPLTDLLGAPLLDRRYRLALRARHVS